MEFENINVVYGQTAPLQDLRSGVGRPEKKKRVVRDRKRKYFQVLTLIQHPKQSAGM